MLHFVAAFGCVDRCPELLTLVLRQRNTIAVDVRKDMFDPSLKLQNPLEGGLRVKKVGRVGRNTHRDEGSSLTSLSYCSRLQ